MQRATGMGFELMRDMILSGGRKESKLIQEMWKFLVGREKN